MNRFYLGSLKQQNYRTPAIQEIGCVSLHDRLAKRLDLIKVDPPELSIAPCCEVASRVHCQDIVADQQIALFPAVVVSHPTIMEEICQDIADCGAVLVSSLSRIFDLDLGGFKLGLGLRPRLVETETRTTSGRVVDHYGQATKHCGIKG